MNEYWAHKWRDFRHSPCLMRPVTALILTTLSLLMFLSLLFQFPGFLLGFLIAPLSRRSVWFVEFLYPSSIARWGHLFLLRLGARSRNASITVHVEDVSGKTGGYMLKSLPLHSRAIEQRIEVIQGRVYIHPLPQLLDNIGYLIVGLPTPNVSSPSFKNTPTMVDLPPIVAILIDCGEADSVKNQIQLIRKLHYPNYDLQVHLILSTHKHHDHTAGTATLVRDPKFNRHLKHVCGGVVENVPLKILLPQLRNTCHPKSLEVCTLLEKRLPQNEKDLSEDQSSSETIAKYCGFSIPNKFIIGFGLDFNDLYRDLKDIWVISDLGVSLGGKL